MVSCLPAQPSGAQNHQGGLQWTMGEAGILLMEREAVHEARWRLREVADLYALRGWSGETVGALAAIREDVARWSSDELAGLNRVLAPLWRRRKTPFFAPPSEVAAAVGELMALGRVVLLRERLDALECGGVPRGALLAGGPICEVCGRESLSLAVLAAARALLRLRPGASSLLDRIPQWSPATLAEAAEAADIVTEGGTHLDEEGARVLEGLLRAADRRWEREEAQSKDI